MKTLSFAGLLAGMVLCVGASISQAQELKVTGDEHGMHANHQGHIHEGPASPVSVMGDHLHDEGEWMLSYRFMRMEMEGNRNGTSDLGPQDISGVVANRFSGMAGQPATLRIVPTEMTMDMHMIGAMYAPTDWVTLMVMGNYLDMEMDHITFAGGNPALEIGRFTTESNGIGDTKLATLFGLYEAGNHQVVGKIGGSLPTGSIDETGTILNPMGANVRIRLPYAMQLGTGTYDIEPGLTYTGHQGDWGWGAQYNGRIHLGENGEDYTRGDKHAVNAWLAYLWGGGFSSSARVAAETEDSIDGIDPQIIGPVQTADPDNYGGERVEIGLGINFSPGDGALRGHEFGAEILVPVYQDLNGPQLERDYSFTMGYRFAF